MCRPVSWDTSSSRSTTCCRTYSVLSPVNTCWTSRGGQSYVPSGTRSSPLSRMRRVTGNRHGDKSQDSQSYTQGHLLTQPLVVAYNIFICLTKMNTWHHSCRHIILCLHLLEHRRRPGRRLRASRRRTSSSRPPSSGSACLREPWEDLTVHQLLRHLRQQLRHPHHQPRRQLLRRLCTFVRMWATWCRPSR